MDWIKRTWGWPRTVAGASRAAWERVSLSIAWFRRARRWAAERRPVAPKPAPTPGRWRPLLSRADQWTVALLVAGCFTSILVYWYLNHTMHHELIEIDRAPPLVADFQVSVNEADWPEFTLLPGIGPTLARRIVAYRHEHGPFKSIEQIEQVRGIGPKTLRRVRAMLLVD